MSYRALADHFVQQATGFTAEDLLQLIREGGLDEHYMALVESSDLLATVAATSPDSEYLLEAARLIDGKEAEVLDFYHTYFDHHDLIGDGLACTAPDAVFILACKDLSIMQRRVHAALPLIESNPGALIVLCGGGFDVRSTEAAVMAEALRVSSPADRRVVLEEDSIDTVGNAVFSKLRLRQELGSLDDLEKLVVVTSEFHAVRSLSIFRRVYGPECSIAVIAANITESVDEEMARARHELKTDCRSSSEIFSVPDPFTRSSVAVRPGDEETILQQLIRHHDLYRHRYDLVRKYQHVLAAARNEADSGIDAVSNLD